MRNIKFTSIDRVISKLYRDLGLEEVNEQDLIEWSGEALEHIDSVKLLEEAVAFIEIKNHQAELPTGLHSIIQVARNNKWERQEEKVCPADVVLDCPLSSSPTEIEIKELESKPCNPNQGVRIDCNGAFIEDFEIAYYRPFFDLQYNYLGWTNSRLYKADFTPIRLTNHTLFGSLITQSEDPIYLKTRGTSQDEYTIQDGMIRTSFKEGQVAIAYYRQKLDPNTGYPMIPDEVSTIQAITYYITWKYMSRLWYMGREGYGDKMQYAEKQWIWYCKQAGVKSLMPHGVDAYQNILESKYNYIPSYKSYYSFFGKLGKTY